MAPLCRPAKCSITYVEANIPQNNEFVSTRSTAIGMALIFIKNTMIKTEFIEIRSDEFSSS